MHQISNTKIIFFLLSVLVITTIIGEFSRIEKIKEGMAAGGLIIMFLKLVMCFFQFIIMIFYILFWLLQLQFLWFYPQFLPWFLKYIVCAIGKFTSIPNCFLWYVMEIAGKIIYLPFRLTFAILDMILESFGFNIKIQDMVDQMWWFLDDIDHMMYDSGSGFHIVHYPDEIIDICYSCDIGDFPSFPPFDMKPINDFVKCIK
jgi:hypothetical protein